MNTKILKISIFAIIAVLAFGCKKYKSVAPDNFTPMREANYTVQELITKFGIDNPNYPTRIDDSYSNAKEPFSVNPIVSDTDIIIVGRVTSDDYAGNMYKYITIQDLNSDWNLRISIDASNIGAIYPLGCVISIKCNGLAIGRYADMYQLGVLYYNDHIVSRKRGWEPGRMPLPIFEANTEKHDISALEIETLTIKEINQRIATDRSLHSGLIRIKNAYFTGEEYDSYGNPVTIKTDELKIFAPSTNGVGFPQSRLITDDTGEKIAIATSEYARFAKVHLPASNYKGDVIAIAAWYKDRARYEGKPQLTLRSLDDLDLYNTIGEKWKP